MSSFKNHLLAGLLALLALASAQANVVTGRLWHVPDATAGNAIPANVPGTAADVTFDVNAPLNFNAGVNPTVSAFLASGGAFNILESTAGTLASALSNGTIGSIMEFTGQVTVTNGQVFSIQHDDGLTLIIGSLTVVSAPGPTAPVVTNATYTGPSGTFNFQLVYGECCAGAAVLAVNLPLSNVPEPATLGLVGAALLGLGLSRRRRLA